MPAFRFHSNTLTIFVREKLRISPRRVCDELDLKTAATEQARSQNFVTSPLELSEVTKASA
jgi:hypothetical protein